MSMLYTLWFTLCQVLQVVIKTAVFMVCFGTWSCVYLELATGGCTFWNTLPHVNQNGVLSLGNVAMGLS